MCTAELWQASRAEAHDHDLLKVSMCESLRQSINTLTSVKMRVVQIADGPVLVASAFAIIILASVIPIIRGADLNISGAGPFTQRAEVCFLKMPRAAGRLQFGMLSDKLPTAVFVNMLLLQGLQGLYVSNVQVWNGRLAMLAFATLIAVETFKAGPGLVP